MTDAEYKLWWHLRRMPIKHTHFRRQATVGPYFADFACHDKRLIIEVDGGQHNQKDHIVADKKRTEYLDSQGYRVLRFWNNDVLTNIDGVMESIYGALCNNEERPPPLTPPHRFAGEGERRGRAPLYPASASPTSCASFSGSARSAEDAPS
jgi:very-short-patch-repair endonuclease